MGRQSPVPGAWLLVQEGRPPPASWPLASLADPTVSPPPRGHLLGSGKERPHPRAVFSPLRRTDRSPALWDPGPRPRLAKFPVRDPGLRLSFTLSSGSQRPRRLPKPRCAHARLWAPPPAACVGGGRGGCRTPQALEPENAARGSGELTGWGPDGAGFPSLAAIPLSCRVSLF